MLLFATLFSTLRDPKSLLSHHGTGQGELKPVSGLSPAHRVAVVVVVVVVRACLCFNVVKTQGFFGVS